MMRVHARDQPIDETKRQGAALGQDVDVGHAIRVVHKGAGQLAALQVPL
jgi:hypothetical protein